MLNRNSRGRLCPDYAEHQADDPTAEVCVPDRHCASPLEGPLFAAFLGAVRSIRGGSAVSEISVELKSSFRCVCGNLSFRVFPSCTRVCAKW